MERPPSFDYFPRIRELLSEADARVARGEGVTTQEACAMLWRMSGMPTAYYAPHYDSGGTFRHHSLCTVEEWTNEIDSKGHRVTIQRVSFLHLDDLFDKRGKWVQAMGADVATLIDLMADPKAQQTARKYAFGETDYEVTETPAQTQARIRAAFEQARRKLAAQKQLSVPLESEESRRKRLLAKAQLASPMLTEPVEAFQADLDRLRAQRGMPGRDLIAEMLGSDQEEAA